MGRSLNARSASEISIDMVPIGGIASMFRSGADYKAIGELVKRADYPQLSTAFPRARSISSALTPIDDASFGSSDFAYGGGIFVNVGGNSSAQAAGRCRISRDGGKTWQNRLLPATTQWTDVVYGNGQFVAMAGGSGIIATSPDGEKWTQQTAPGNSSPNTLCFGGGLFFFAVANTNQAYTSPDGVTWTPRTLPAVANWTCAAWGNGTFLVVSRTASGVGSAISATSPDGITWTPRTFPNAVQNGAYVTYGKAGSISAFVLIASVPSAILTSTDGVTWVTLPVPLNKSGGDAVLTGVVAGNGVWIIFSGNSAFEAAFMSVDGLKFQPFNILPTGSAAASAVGYGDGVFLYQSRTTGEANIGRAYAENDTDSEYLYLSGTAGQFVRVK